MPKTIKQTMQEYLKEQKPKLALRTYKYHEEALGWLERCINSYGANNLDKKDEEKWKKNYDKGIELCDSFESQILDDSYFSELLGYFYPKKVGGGRDTANKICGATINYFKWMVAKKYILLEEENDEILLKETVDHLRYSFKEGWEEYNNFDKNFDY